MKKIIDVDKIDKLNQKDSNLCWMFSFINYINIINRKKRNKKIDLDYLISCDRYIRYKKLEKYLKTHKKINKELLKYYISFEGSFLNIKDSVKKYGLKYIDKKDSWNFETEKDNLKEMLFKDIKLKEKIKYLKKVIKNFKKDLCTTRKKVKVKEINDLNVFIYTDGKESSIEKLIDAKKYFIYAKRLYFINNFDFFENKIKENIDNEIPIIICYNDCNADIINKCLVIEKNNRNKENLHSVLIIGYVIENKEIKYKILNSFGRKDKYKYITSQFLKKYLRYAVFKKDNSYYKKIKGKFIDYIV